MLYRLFQNTVEDVKTYNPKIDADVQVGLNDEMTYAMTLHSTLARVHEFTTYQIKFKGKIFHTDGVYLNLTYPILE
jgi:hypothetical protein